MDLSKKSLPGGQVGHSLRIVTVLVYVLAIYISQMIVLMNVASDTGPYKSILDSSVTLTYLEFSAL